MSQEDERLSHQDSAILFITALQNELAKASTTTNAPVTARGDTTGGEIRRLKERKSTPPTGRDTAEHYKDTPEKEATDANEK